MVRFNFLAWLRPAAEGVEWFSSMDIARRAYPKASKTELVRRSRDISRRLSNIHRYGHVDRRVKDNSSAQANAPMYEYRLKRPALRVCSVFDLARQPDAVAA